MTDRDRILVFDRFAPEPLDRGHWAALALASIAIVHLPWAIHLASSGRSSVLSDLAVLLAGGLCVHLLLGAARSPNLDAPGVRAFRLLAAGQAAILLGDAVWLFCQNFVHSPPALAAAAPAYFVAYPLQLAAVLTLPRAHERAGAHARFWLDVAAVLTSGVMATWWFLSRSGLREDLDPDRVLVHVGFAAGDVLLFFAFAVLLLRPAAPELRPAFALIGLGLLLVAVSDGLYALEYFSSGRRAGGRADAMALMATALTGLGAYAFRGRFDARLGPVARAIARHDHMVLPNVAQLIGFGVLFLAVFRGQKNLGFLLGGALLLAVLLVMRQVVGARENELLLEEAAELRGKARFEALVESSADVIALIERDGRFRYASASLFKALGQRPEQMVGKSLLEVIHPEDLEAARAVLEDCVAQGGRHCHAEFRLRHADGGWRYFEADGVNQLANPEVGAIAATFRDVSARRRAEQELTAQKDLLSSLLAVARATAQSPGLAETLKNALGAVKDAVGAEGGSIILVDERGGVLSSVFAEGHGLPSATRSEHSRQVLREGLAGWVARRHEAAVVEDVAKDERWLPRAGDAVGSALAIPIASGGELVGVLTLVHPNLGFFESHHLRLARDASEQIGLALRNAQVFDSLGNMAERLRLLNEFMHTAVMRLDPEALLAAAVKTIFERTPWRSVALGVPDRERQQLRFLGAAVDWSPTPPLSIEVGITGRAFRTGQTQLVPDVTSDPDYVGSAPGVRSELDVPLKHGGRVLGILNIESEEPDHFTEDDVRLAESLADTIALSLDEALTYKRLSEESARLQAVIAASRDGILLLGEGRVLLINPPAAKLLGLAGSPEAWHGKLAGEVPQLERLTEQEGELSLDGSNAVRYLAQRVATGPGEGRLIVLRDVTEEHQASVLREDLTHTLIHDLRTPLNSVMGFLELLGQSPSLNESHHELLEVAGRATQRLVSMVDTILDVSRLEKGTMPLDTLPCPLQPIVQEVLDLQRTFARSRALAIEADIPAELPRVMADAGVMRRVIENLTSNALRHTPRGGAVSVGASVLAGTSYLEVKVSDTGPGISPEEQLHIFDKWVTGAQRERGTGLGLAFCRMAVEAHGGRIRVESAPGRGAAFAFTLPLA